MSALPVFYNPRSVSYPRSYSPSAYKPRQVVDDWTAKHPANLNLQYHAGLLLEMAMVAHDQRYVTDVMTGKQVTGFGRASPEVAASCMYTCGGVLAAAAHVVGKDWKGYPIACAPYSGFHHAGYDFGGGFCTFNGLAIAALQLIAMGKIERVLILDCDYHYGDGTQDILDRAGDDTAFVTHWTAGANYHFPDQAGEFMLELRQVIKANRKTDLVIYQAGADPHIKDPLGGFLTDQQLQARDRIVFETCAEFKLPIIWTLAGGYQDPIKKVLAIHERTFLESIHLLDQHE